MPGSMLEDNFKEHYNTWLKDPSPANNANILKVLQPSIEGAIKTHVGNSNPLLMSRAKLMTLEGLKNYDPKRSRLQTYLYNHLQGLKRVNRQQTTVLKVPERISLDRYNLEQAASELASNLGREPHDEELANHTGLSMKRIARIRTYNPAVSEGKIEELTGASGPMGGVLGKESEHPIHLDILYDSLDDYHKKILEHTIGYGNHRILSNTALAKKMRRSAGAISQAKLRVQEKIDEMESLMQTAL